MKDELEGTREGIPAGGRARWESRTSGRRARWESRTGGHERTRASGAGWKPVSRWQGGNLRHRGGQDARTPLPDVEGVDDVGAGGVAGGEDAGEDAEGDGEGDGEGDERPGDVEGDVVAPHDARHGDGVAREVQAERETEAAAEDAEDEGFADDEAEDQAAGGADGAHDGDLFGAAGDVGGHEVGDADGGNNEGDRGDGGEEVGHAREFAVDLVLEFAGGAGGGLRSVEAAAHLVEDLVLAEAEPALGEGNRLVIVHWVEAAPTAGTRAVGVDGRFRGRLGAVAVGPARGRLSVVGPSLALRARIGVACARCG